MPPFIQNLLALPAKTKALLGVSAFAILAIAFLLLKIATAPSYALIASGLDPAQTGKITAALDEQGIAYELRNNGTALAVQKAQRPQARIALAGAGRRARAAARSPATSCSTSPSSAPPSSSSRSPTSARWRVRSPARCAASRACRTRPCSSCCRRTTSSRTRPRRPPPRSCSATPPTRWSRAPCAAWRSSSPPSVKGLKSENVTITDSTGQVLWPSGDGAGRRRRAARQAERRGALRPPVEASLNAMLAPHARPEQGPGQGQRRSQRGQVHTGGAHLRREGHADQDLRRRPRRSRAARRPPAAPPAPARNVPTYSAGAAGAGGNSNYERTKTTPTFGVNKKITKTEDAPGAVNKLNVALMVDKSVPADVYELAAADGGRRRRHRPRARRHCSRPSR